MPPPALTLVAPPPSRRAADPVRVAVEQLARSLPARTDAAVLVDLLEDDLREGLDALGEVEAHFTDLLDTLRTEALTPAALVDSSDDLRVLQQLDSLHDAVVRLRKRLSQAAGMSRLAQAPVVRSR
ncbi:hypothetical protein [Myxococcus sp. SDU36]|uniref:hypothetical protein n=1 Tax=Myxococcus sp. SDU36 TaxID=2831967 RepID=UPI0025437046|nr:hypothetical protein [Myxococcus sp. SDU36]WIG96305.1 hypothetical protein KGD87_02285 [Myxococcus sp. SDU36]